MTLAEFRQLQAEVFKTHPLLDISSKKIGTVHSNEWAAVIDATGYWLWNMQDWLDYRDTFIKRLEIFTNEGKAIAQAKYRQTRAENKKKRELLTA